MKPMRVGYVVRKFPVLSETFVLNELLALEERGVELHVFSLMQPNDPRFHDALPRLRARVDYVPGWSAHEKLLRHNRRVAGRVGAAYRRALAEALFTDRLAPKTFLQAGFVADEARRLKLDHLHAQFANTPTEVARYASHITGIPFSFTAHAMDIFKSEVNPGRLTRSVRDARFVVTVSDYNREFLERTTGETGRIARIYNGIDLERFSPNGTPPPEPFRIVCVARLVEKKGLPDLIDACARLRDEGLDFTCEIVGKGRLRSPLEARIKRLDLRKHVKLLGPRNQAEVGELYRHAHLYVLPCIVGSDGNRDGLPVSIVEALASGLPVVTTPVTGIPEAVTDGVNGRIVPSGDVDRLAEALADLIRNRERYERLRAGARPSVLEKFDRDRAAEHLHRLLRGEAA